MAQALPSTAGAAPGLLSDVLFPSLAGHLSGVQPVSQQSEGPGKLEINVFFNVQIDRQNELHNQSAHVLFCQTSMCHDIVQSTCVLDPLRLITCDELS